MSRLTIPDLLAIFIVAVVVITLLVLGFAYHPMDMAIACAVLLFIWALVHLLNKGTPDGR